MGNRCHSLDPDRRNAVVALSLTYDAGALIAAERGDDRMRALHEAALAAGMLPTVPSAVLAQAWRGGPQDRLARVLRGCVIESLGESRARAVGALCGRAQRSDIVDACVVLGAGIRGDAIVTSDRDDLEHLADVLGLTPSIIDV